MVKKKLFAFFLLVLFSFSLSSCHTFSFSEWGKGYVSATKELEKAPSPTLTYDALNAYDEGEFTPALSARGNQKALVVPVEFSDFLFPSDYQEKLETAFLGPNPYFYSVQDYYSLSSYGALSLDFVITDKIEMNVTASEFMKGTSNHSRKTVRLLREALSSLSSSLSLIDFDQNQDGYLDAVYLVYSAPTYEEHDYVAEGLNAEEANEFWAYTYYDYGANANFSSPVGMDYIWCSYSFLERSSIGADTHTLIHETGHLFGLPDYYNSASFDDTYRDERYKYRMPLGGLDMMDLGLGDHHAWTKYALGWSSPYLVYQEEGSFTVELKDTSYGESIFLLPDSGEISPFSEGIMIELLSLDTLSSLDAEKRYLGQYPLYYSLPGIRITHVDARIVEARRSGNLILKDHYVFGITNDDLTLEPYFYTVGADNDPRNSKEDAYSLLELVEADQKNHLDQQDGANIYYADNNDLFYPEEGKNIFSPSYLGEKGLLHSGESFPYQIQINGIRDLDKGKSASITISRV